MKREALLVFALGVAACTKSGSSSNALSVRQVIEATNAKLVRWYAAGQIDSVVQAFSTDVWQLYPNGAPLIGRDSLRAFWTRVTGWGRVEFELQTQDVATADNLAVERGRYVLRFTARPQSPMPSFADRGNYLTTWRQESDGRWRAVWDAPVSTLPLPASSTK